MARGPKIADKYTSADSNLVTRMVADSKVEPDYSGATIVFTNGKRVSVSLDEVPSELHARLACHGLSQKLGDSYANVAGNLELAYSRVSDVAELLKAGGWEKETREGGLRLSDLFEAVNTYRAELSKPAYSDDEFKAKYVRASDAETMRNGAKAHPRVGAILIDIQTRKLAERKKEIEAGAASATSIEI